MRRKHVKNIRMYHADPKSFKKLQDKDFFKDFYRLKKDRELVIELTIELSKALDPNGHKTRTKFKEVFDIYLSLVETRWDKKISSLSYDRLFEGLYNELKQGRFFHLRGEILEFLIVNYMKSNRNKIYHEPKFYHKRKPLFRNDFEGKNSLIDVVQFDLINQNIKLIECKANINNHIRKINGAFRKKLNLMDNIELELSNYTTYNDEKVKVSKNLATIIDQINKGPEGYNFINLLECFQFRLSEKQNAI